MPKIKKPEKAKAESFYSKGNIKSFSRYQEEKQFLINEALDRYLPSETTPPAVIHRAMRDAVFPGGKRLRPFLVLVAAEVVGGSCQRVLPAACALELIHTYSLVHDDLPALDNDSCRRGKPSLHAAFGEDIAILAGDALLTLAFGLLGEDKNGEKYLSRVIRETARAVGTLGMIGGQVDDLGLEKNKEVKLECLESVYYRKTGALLELCLRVGAFLGGGSPGEVETLSNYGRNIGLAFQIIDDILDINEVGERAAYPVLMGEDKARARAAGLIKEAKEEIASLRAGKEILQEIADLILKRSDRNN